MNKLKKYLLLMLAMLTAAIIGAVAVWYLLVLAPLKDAQNQLEATSQNVTNFDLEADDGFTSESSVGSDNSENNTIDPNESLPEGAPLVIKKSSLPEAQQSILTTFGFGEEITITAQMQICAEAKLGSSRLAEIIAGDTPSILEASSLVSCLKK